MAKREWLKKLHPIYEHRSMEWARNERRIRGGIHVMSELRRFDWETPPNSSTMEQDATARMAEKDGLLPHVAAPGQHYAQRQEQAIYVNFPDQFMGMLVGHLFRKRPLPEKGLDFGTLGTVPRVRSTATPTFAELVYYNADGVGNDGSHWDAFWADVERWAGATGHRWLFVEASAQPGITQQDVVNGKRPYLRHLSPLKILNWDHVDGKLAWAVEQLPPRAAVVRDGKLVRETRGPVRLYVRAGYAGFDMGDDILFSAGGWWTFDKDGERLSGDGMEGRWDKTKGDIPLWPHFYQRDQDYVSRPGVTELGNAAVAYMNLDSAATYDAWDAASSLQFLLGVTPDTFKVAMDKVREGSKIIPVPSSSDGAGGSTAPSIQDSATGAVAADVFLKRLDAIRAVVRELSNAEATGAADSSGLSKMAGFADGKAPKLGLLASEMESSQNIALYFLELRFGTGSPAAAVTWTRDFELAPVLDTIERLFALEATADLRSPTLGARLMVQAGQEVGIITDDKEREVIQEEYKTAAIANGADRQRAASMLGEFGRDGEDPAEPEPTPEPAPTEEPVKAGKGQEIQTTEATVLNGAQITAAKDIVLSVAKAELPRDSGVAMLTMFFNLAPDKAEAIMGESGKGTKLTPNTSANAGAAPPAKDDKEEEVLIEK